MFIFSLSVKAKDNPPPAESPAIIISLDCNLV